jgi:hypothetical protein
MSVKITLGSAPIPVSRGKSNAPAPGGPINTILGAFPLALPPMPTALLAVSRAEDMVLDVDFSICEILSCSWRGHQRPDNDCRKASLQELTQFWAWEVEDGDSPARRAI